jgi:flavin reductase (DIM6/NTAB) family NADH-FMN oxidoreductase RutF
MNNKVERNTYRPIFPTPAGLVVSIDAAGKPNIITLGEIFNLSIREPVWVGIAIRESRYSWELIKEQKEFTVNLPPTALLNAVRGIGVYSGRDVDKFAKYKLTALPSKFVKPPIIAECPVNLECKLVEFHHVGDHDLFIGEVLLEHVDADKVKANGERDESKLDPIVWLGRGFYKIGEKIGEYEGAKGISQPQERNP